MSDPSRTPPPSSDDHGAALAELVSAQLRAARAEVFQAWQAAREKASRLGGEEDQELPRRRGAA